VKGGRKYEDFGYHMLNILVQLQVNLHAVLVICGRSVRFWREFGSYDS
jgi:hypothetical protein